MSNKADGFWKIVDEMPPPEYQPVYQGTIPDKLQPHNLEAEESVLGSLLIDPDAIIRITAGLGIALPAAGRAARTPR